MIAAVRPLPLRVLVVDDCVDTTRTLSLLLQLWGHEVCAAYDGLAALEAARVYQPDVVLLDIGLPRLDGCEVARRLRERAGPEELLLVMLTGYGQDAYRRRSREAGIDYFFLKPIDPDELRRLLARAATGALPRTCAREGCR